MQDCIRSIEAQTYKNYEVIIVDGESNDGTRAILDELKSPFRAIIEQDEGVYDAMNKGIKAAKGEWLYFMGADDQLYSETTLSDIFNKDISQDTALVIGSIVYNYTADDSKFVKKNDGVFQPRWSSKLWIKNTVHHQGVFYRRYLFDNSGYDTKYKVLGDYDFNLRLYKTGTKADVIETIIAKCGTSGISKDYNWKLYRQEIALKAQYSNPLCRPLLYGLGVAKYLVKKII